MTGFARYPSLADKTVIITGGGSGIGAAMVEAFAAQGAKVAFLDIAEEPSRALVEALRDAKHKPVFYPNDVSQTDELKRTIAQIGQDLGPASVLVNNAANDDRHEIDDVDEAYWDWSMNVNLRHHFFAAQAVRPQMRELGGGSIINFSSVTWFWGPANLAIYTTAKAGVVGLTRSLARAFGDDQIRVNAVVPGAVRTERQITLWNTKESHDAIAQRQMIKRTLMPDDLARTVLFLAADDSAMITRQDITVDAGLR
ncbi:MAG: SDR family oxidoreductase [Pseudomonadota bacterium]